VRQRVHDVELTSLTIAHAEAMFRWMCDPAVAENLGLRGEPTIEKSRAFVERAAVDETVCARAVLVSGAHVGNVVLDRLDRHGSTGRLHLYVGEPSARGKGVGKRVVTLALVLAFDELCLHKVWLTVHARNGRAISVYTAMGFHVEGVHREEFVLRGERIDEFYMGVLAREFSRRR
jgi:RimJ/RimL family protein N-acetyltransferase